MAKVLNFVIRCSRRETSIRFGLRLYAMGSSWRDRITYIAYRRLHNDNLTTSLEV